MLNLKRVGQIAIAILVLPFSNLVLAAGTAQGDPVLNTVNLTYTVNGTVQNDSANVDFVVDRKLVVAVSADDGDWVTTVPGQAVTGGVTGVPALNFTVTNSSNGSARVVLGLIDQSNTAITTFGAPVNPFTTNPTSGVVVALDTNGNNTFEDGVDIELVLNAGGYYEVPVSADPSTLDETISADASFDVLVTVPVDGGEVNGNFRHIPWLLVLPTQLPVILKKPMTAVTSPPVPTPRVPTLLTVRIL